MKASRKNTQVGAALIMVLLISAVLGVLVTLTAYKSRLLVMQGHLIRNSLTAQQSVDDTAAELIFKLTTSSVWMLGPKASRLESAELPKELNFYGRSFKMGDVEVTIQDLSGLVSILPFDEIGFKKLLKYQGLGIEGVNTVTDSLQDWMDSDGFRRLNGAESADYDIQGFPRNAYVQSLFELKEINGIDETIFSSFSRWVTLIGFGGIAEEFAPSMLIKSVKTETASEEIIERRVNNSSLASNFESYPSRRLRVQLSAKYDVGGYSKSFIIVRGRGLRAPFFIAEYKVGE